jgi:DNA-binding MarR family transcriptional regulator
MTSRRKSGRGDVDLTPDAARVLRKFRVLFNSVRRHFRATESKVGISGAHVWALALVGEHPGIGVNDLADAMDVHQSTASNLLRILTEEGLVRADRDELDKRIARLSITPAGRRILKSAPNPYAGILPEALLELDPRTLKRLDRDLEELISIVGPNERSARTPMGQSDSEPRRRRSTRSKAAEVPVPTAKQPLARAKRRTAS